MPLPSLSGYKFCELLHKGTLSNIYRAIRETDQSHVVIKLSTQKTLKERTIQSFRREFELGRQVNSPYVIRYLDLHQDLATDEIALVMESDADDAAVELASILSLQGVSNAEFLKIAIQIVQGLQAIHAANIVHNDLKFSNILIRPIARTIKIIDFNLASSLPQQTQSTISIRGGTLAYSSPEQTGRINRSVDYRTDFYSLGVVFYQLLCGQLPFTAKDAMGMIHQHLAKQPLPPHQYNSSIASALSQIVMKLLEKEAENRYQSCEGILYDLTCCQSALQQTSCIPEFELGQQDFSNKLTLSQHLYGREKEIKALVTAFERVSEGHREGFMVAGQPGVGKTMLIQEIQKPITLRGGYFIAGKFDQLNKTVAYSAFTQAFDDLIKQLLTEDEARIAEWKMQLLAALGAHAGYIIKVVPTLALLIGEQPTTAIADINQAKMVFNLAFQAFVNVFANAAHPLVIFLDDLQWADSASLELMVYLLQQPTISHLLWIGAYRDTEVTTSHPAIQAITALQAAEVNVKTLALAPLPLKNLQQWIADSFRMSLSKVRPLANLLNQKTAGNPFFVKLFLRSLYDQHLLTFSQEAHWLWDLDKIQQHPATENVITLMTYHIQQLPAATQTALSIASCIGHRLAISTLQAAMDSSSEVVSKALQPALNHGILIRTHTEIYFVHDRVQEAAYCLLAETEKAQTHLMIGKRLLAHFSTNEAWLFDIVSQFNRCRSLITEQAECLQLADLNLQAAQQAKQATAYAAALEYLHAVSEWIDTQELWQTDYSLAFTYHRELAEVEYLSGHMDISQALIAKIQPYLQSNLEKVEIYRLLIIQNTLQGHYQEAITIGRNVLQLLGSDLPLDNLPEFIQKTAIAIKQKLQDIPLYSLLDAPLIVEAKDQALFKILGVLYSPSFMKDMELLSAITLVTINLSLRLGQHTLESCLSYAMYGLVLCVKFEEYALSYQFADLALQLAKKLQSPLQYCRSAMIMYAFIYPWSKSIQQLPPLWSTTYEASQACGELEFAGYCAVHAELNSFYQGISLAKVQQEALHLLQFVQNTKNQIAIHSIQAIQRVLANLMGNTLDECNFDTSVMDEGDFLEVCQQSNSFFALSHYYFLKAQAFHLYDHFDQAFEQLSLAKKYLAFVSSSYVIAQVNWYDSLICLARYPMLVPEEQQFYLQQVTQNQQKMKKWQASCPENFTHKYVLVAAELARLQGRYEEAETYYEQAVALAGRHGFIQEKALAAELTAKYWLERGRPLCAQGYLNDAFNSYKQWGAKRKLTQLKTHHADLLHSFASSSLSQLVVSQEITLSDNTLKFLDLSSILKASHTISSEIELPKLLRNMMQIVIENAGAQQGAVLFIEADDTVSVQAEYISDGTITTLQKIPLANWSNGAHTVVQYVKRLNQSVILDEAATHEQFNTDPYIDRIQAKSILCIPLLKHSELKAILYVENNLMSHAFTPERVQTVQILAAQMAISLENARYFAEQLALTRQLTEQSARAQVAEESLHAVTHDLQLALQASKAGTWNWRIGTDSITWDAANHKLFGLKPGQFKGTYAAFIECVHPDDRERVDQTVKQCIEQDMPQDMEYRVIWPDGSQHVLTAQGRVYRNDHGEPIKMAGVSTDITQRKQLEQERFQALQRAEEEQRQRAKEAIIHKKKLEEITDTMCHELRNPLNGLCGGIELLREDLEKLKPSTSMQSEVIVALQEQLQTMDLCAEQEKAIVNDVLEYSKVEHQTTVLAEEPFDVKATITSSVRMLFPQIKQKNLEVICELAIPDELAGMPYLLKGDSRRLNQILLNLISNAIKFTSKGSIKIAAGVKPLSVTETELWVTIKDSGIGIAGTEYTQIFERFSQASRRTGSEYGGSGLGLATTKKLVEMMGGEIWVESQQGQGSKFSFNIKCKNLSNEEQVLWQTKMQPKRSENLQHTEGGEIIKPEANTMVLIVEDNLVNQTLLSKYLEKLGYRYQLACDGLQAIEKFKSSKFAAILMDIAMPNMDGLEATHKIRQLEREQALNLTPIIGLSGYSSEEFQQKALQAGMDDYLIKPYLRADILNMLEKYAASKSAGQEEQALPSAYQKMTTPVTKMFTDKTQAKSSMEKTEMRSPQRVVREMEEEEENYETSLALPSCNII